MRRYRISSLGKDGDITTWLVEWTPSGQFDRKHVWESGDGSLACVGCQTPLRGMSGCCLHVKAVRRHLAALRAGEEKKG